MLPDQGSHADDDVVDSTPDDPGPARSLWWAIGAVVTAVLVAVGVSVIALRPDSRTSTVRPAGSADGRAGQTIRYLVPLGTGSRIDAGENVVIIPEELRLKVGDTLEIVNEDDRTHTVGGYIVRPADTLEITYPRAGLYMNACSTNTSELVYVYVDP